MPEDETVLSGGNTNARVVRIGQTVRRHMTRASPTVHRLLRHLEDVGFASCPRFLGTDEQGREVLSYLHGETGLVEDLWTGDEPLLETARMLRRYHDATKGFSCRRSDFWAFSHPDPTRHEVICHNDFAPYNFVFSKGIPVAVLDFDLAGPGPRLWDVAYAAYWLTPLSFAAADLLPFSNRDVQAGCRRLKLFCETYGIEPDRALLDTVAEVLAHMADEKGAARILGSETADSLGQSGHFKYWRDEATAFLRMQPNLLRNLH